MSRRTLEAALKFEYQRLLKKEPVNTKGHVLMLNDLIPECVRCQCAPVVHGLNCGCNNSRRSVHHCGSDPTREETWWRTSPSGDD
jgi:hypothetical protein